MISVQAEEVLPGRYSNLILRYITNIEQHMKEEECSIASKNYTACADCIEGRWSID